MTRQFILFNMRSTFSPKILAKGQYSVCVCGIDSTLHSTPVWIRSFAYDALLGSLDCISREFCRIEDEGAMSATTSILVINISYRTNIWIGA